MQSSTMAATRKSVLIKGIGVYAPDNIVTNDDLAQKVETSDEWIRTRSGIRERRIAPDGLLTSDLAVEAGKAAIRDAGIKPEDVDLLIVATMSPDMPVPSTACIVQHKLGLRHIPAFDIVAACSGFLYMLEVGTQMMRSGLYRNALIIGAEKMSAILDWQDRSTCVLFGDGAGACVLQAGDDPAYGVLDAVLGADGTTPSLLHIPAGGSASPTSHATVDARSHYLKMNGKEVFKLAVREMGDAIVTCLEKNGLRPDQITCFIPHQANIRIIDSLAKRLDVSMDRFLINIDRFGNTSAASIPLALEEARRLGRFNRGDYLMLVAFGAGLTWAATPIRWA